MVAYGAAQSGVEMSNWDQYAKWQSDTLDQIVRRPYRVRVVERDGVERYLREGFVNVLTEHSDRASSYAWPGQAAAAIERYMMGRDRSGIHCDVISAEDGEWKWSEE